MEKNLNNKELIETIIWTLAIISVYHFAGGLYFVFSDIESEFTALFMGISQLVFILIPVIIISSRSNDNITSILRLNPTNIIDIALAVTGVIAFQFFLNGYSTIQEALIPDCLIDSYKNMQKEILDLQKELFNNNTVWGAISAFLAAVLIPPISEELLFRGYFQKNLEKNMSWTVALLISSFLFAIIHFNIIDFVPLLLTGFYLGFLAYKTESIYVPIIAHFSNNLIAFVVLKLWDNDLLPDQEETIPLLWAIVMLILSTAIIIYIIYLLFNRSIRAGRDKWS